MIEFEVIPFKNTYNSENFKIYICKVDKSAYPNIKKNNYGDVTILGNIQELSLDVKYLVSAEEDKSKYGYQYNVKFIKRDIPTDYTSSKIFLEEILTPKQATVLLESYPNIIDMVIKDNLDSLDLNTLKGIKEKTWVKIEKKILDNFALIELVEKFNGFLSMNIIKKLFNKYGSVKNILDKVKINPYQTLTSIGGIGFKTADSILLNMEKTNTIEFEEPLLKSKDRMKACIIYLLTSNEIEKGNTKMLLSALENKAKCLTSECIMYFDEVVENDKEIFNDNQYIARAFVRTTEQYIATKVELALSSPKKWKHIDINYYKYSGVVRLTDKQLSALQMLCDNSICILEGKSGTGKTTTLSTIVEMLKGNRITFRLLAPTGKAANVLEQYCRHPASTIHRGLMFKPPNIWEINNESPFGEQVIIVDESSMIDVFLMSRLVDAIDFSKTKLLLVGDSDQVPSVGAGNILHDLINSKKVSLTSLNQVFRFGEGGLMNVATHVREMKQYLSDEPIQQFGQNKDYIYINCPQESSISYVKDIYRKILLSGAMVDDIAVLTTYNKGDYGTIRLNKELQAIANSYASCSNDNGLKIGETNYYKNDLIMQVVNNYKAVIFNEKFNKEDVDPDLTLIANGETGRILEITNNGIIIQFENYRIFYKHEIISDNIKLGYCIGIIKSQGSEFKHVVVLTPKAHTYMLNSNLIYVGLTRAKEKCYHIGEKKTIDSAIKIKANFDRMTFLKDFVMKK